METMSLLEAVRTTKAVAPAQPGEQPEDPRLTFVWTPEWQREIRRKVAAGEDIICYSDAELDAAFDEIAQ